MNVRKIPNEKLGRHNIKEFLSKGKNPIYVVLDNVRSMNNVGSVFRSCDAFAVKKLMLCGITPKPPHRDISKTALGSTESVEWQYFSSVSETIIALRKKDVKIVSIEQTNQSLDLSAFAFEQKQEYAFIFGNEIKGVSENALELSNNFISINQFGTKHSLNIAVSVGIVLWGSLEAIKKTIM